MGGTGFRRRLARAALGAALAVTGLAWGHGRAADAAPGTGYVVIDASGAAHGFAGATPLQGSRPDGPVVAAAPTSDHRGWWMVTANGGVVPVGDAVAHGSMAGAPLAAPMAGIAATPDGGGYWLVGADGGVFSFGDARFLGSAALVPFVHAVGIAADPLTGGYWVVADSGSVVPFGAPYLGSPVALPAGVRIVAITATADGLGYRLVADDAEVFSFGTAGTGVSGAISHLRAPVVAVGDTPGDGGYWLLGSDGGVFAHGNAPFAGSPAGRLGAPAVAVMAVPPLLNPFVPGTGGYDISWPQCGGPYPSRPFSLAVVGVNDGRAFTTNPCMAAESGWAGTPLGLYINLNSPAGDPATWQNGPAGSCGSNYWCQSYNYGWNTASWSYQQALGQHVAAADWWLDIETGNSWSGDTGANAQVIQGALDALHSIGLVAAVYSTSYQWGVIAGSFRPGVAEWVATGGAPNPQAWCSGAGFAGGPVWLVQYGPGPFDRDYAC